MSRKRLVVCCDGTWNKAETLTNIKRLRLAIEDRGPDGVRQCCYYLEGVGAGRWTRIRGGLFGFGLNDNIKKAYRWLTSYYEPGDEIWCFGFSRGAYTARSLCGMLSVSGLLRPGHENQVDLAFDHYRLDPKRRAGSRLERRLKALRPYTKDEQLSVRMLGVFDTVGALGVPVPRLAFLSQWRDVRFHDTELSELVENAYHAIAIDERRGPFAPTLWTDVKPAATARHFSGNKVPQNVVQAWFPGVHSDVGGGYPDKRLADVPFLWMLKAAADLGLGWDLARLEEKPDPEPCAAAHDSLTWGYEVAAWWPWIDANEPRVVGDKTRRAKGMKPIAAREALHDATLQRIRDAEVRLPPAQAPYRPPNVCRRDGEVFVDLPIIGQEATRRPRPLSPVPDVAA